MKRCIGANANVMALAILVFHMNWAIAGDDARTEDEFELVYGDRSTITIATGAQQSLRRAPAVATVITADEIAAMGATDLDEVLETVPGIHVSRSNNVYTPLYLVRGIYSTYNPQTLMLQNGVPMTTLFTGSRGLGWAGLPLENIERIEIIRGPGSALYGADAYSGIINIITKNAANAAGTEFGVRAGSFQSRDGWVQYGGKLGSIGVAAYLRSGRTDGFHETVEADAQTFFDAIYGTHASLAPGPVNTGHNAVDGSLELSYDNLRMRAGYKLRDHIGTGAGVTAALDPVGQSKSERKTLDLSWNDLDIARDWKLSLASSYFQYIQTNPTALQLFPPGAFGGAFPDGMIGSPNTWERQLRFSAVTTYSGFANHNLRFGVGHDDLNLYRTQELKNFTVIPSGPFAGVPVPTTNGEVMEFPVADSFMLPQRRKINYVYAQDEWQFARDWALTAGVRHDRYSDFGGTTNPRLALVWDASLDLTAKLLYGRAFRAPAFTELYSINNPVIRGNPDLKPETINTLEVPFTWQSSTDTRINLSLFRYEMDSIIRNVKLADGTSMFNNTGAQHGHGAELELRWDPSRNLRLTGNYAYQRSVDVASGKDAGYAPHDHVYLRADWGFADSWLGSGQINYVGNRKRAAGDLRPETPDYTTVDLTMRTWRSKSGWDFAISVRNLFNADVREPSLAPGLEIPKDLPMARRSLYFQLVYRP